MSVPFTHTDMAALIAQTVNAALDSRLGSAPAAAPAKPAKVEKATTKVRVSPPVLALARDHGIDLATVKGTGKNGAIRKSDVLSLIGTPAPAKVAKPAVDPLPATTSTGKARKVKAVVESQDFTGHGKTLTITKYQGKKRVYAVVTSPDDAEMKLYVSGKVFHLLSCFMRSAECADAMKFVADCR